MTIADIVILSTIIIISELIGMGLAHLFFRRKE